MNIILFYNIHNKYLHISRHKFIPISSKSVFTELRSHIIKLLIVKHMMIMIIKIIIIAVTIIIITQILIIIYMMIII